MREFEKVVPGIALLKVPFNDGSYDTGVVLVRQGTQTLLIDSGECSATVDSHILPALKAAGVEKVDWLLCTHNHGDHSGGHRRLKEILDCPIAVFSADADGFPAMVDRVLEDGESPVPGLKLIATPGHTRSAVCFLHEESGTLLTGDSFQGCATEGVGLALIEDGDLYRQSVLRTMALRAQRIVAGHGFAPCDFVIEGPLRVLAFLRCCLDTLCRYEAFVAAHPQVDDEQLAQMLIESEGRVMNSYIVRGDSTIAACR